MLLIVFKLFTLYSGSLSLVLTGLQHLSHSLSCCGPGMSSLHHPSAQETAADTLLSGSWCPPPWLPAPCSNHTDPSYFKVCFKGSWVMMIAVESTHWVAVDQAPDALHPGYQHPAVTILIPTHPLHIYQERGHHRFHRHRTRGTLRCRMCQLLRR